MRTLRECVNAPKILVGKAQLNTPRDSRWGRRFWAECVISVGMVVVETGVPMGFTSQVY